jgi:hypothetical protein
LAGGQFCEGTGPVKEEGKDDIPKPSFSIESQRKVRYNGNIKGKALK